MYKLFLDDTLTYSSGVYRGPDDSLHQSQLNKIDALVAKAGIKQEHHVLEIGCGWGGFAIRAVQATGCRWGRGLAACRRQRLGGRGWAAAVAGQMLPVRLAVDLKPAYTSLLLRALTAACHPYPPKAMPRLPLPATPSPRNAVNDMRVASRLCRPAAPTLHVTCPRPCPGFGFNLGCGQVDWHHGEQGAAGRGHGARGGGRPGGPHHAALLRLP